jgi:hypothetical protein
MTRRPGQGQIFAALAGSLLLAAVISAPRAASEESPIRSAAVTDERPLAALVALLEERHGMVITYEDPTYRFEGDLTAAAGWPPATETGWQPRAIRKSSLRLSYRVPKARDGVADLTAVVQEAIDLHAAAGNPGRFHLERDGSFLHVIPSEVKGQDGRWKPASPILDVKVDLADADRQLGDAIDLILDAVRRTVGVRVDVVQEPLNSARRIHVRLGATGESARHLLTRAVANFGPGFSWRLLFDTLTGSTALQIYEAAWVGSSRPAVAHPGRSDSPPSSPERVKGRDDENPAPQEPNPRALSSARRWSAAVGPGAGPDAAQGYWRDPALGGAAIHPG